MGRIVIDPGDLQAIRHHGEASYPEECCGFLIGRRDEERTRVERITPVRNERRDRRRNRFLIHPETVLAVHQAARDQGCEVVGYYHSHPDHAAQPSEFDREHAWPGVFDREHAWPGVSYVIVAVAGGRAVEACSWLLADDRQRFDEEAIETADGLAGSPGEIQKEAGP